MGAGPGQEGPSSSSGTDVRPEGRPPRTQRLDRWPGLLGIDDKRCRGPGLPVPGPHRPLRRKRDRQWADRRPPPAPDGGAALPGGPISHQGSVRVRGGYPGRRVPGLSRRLPGGVGRGSSLGALFLGPGRPHHDPEADTGHGTPHVLRSSAILPVAFWAAASPSSWTWRPCSSRPGRRGRPWR